MQCNYAINFLSILIHLFLNMHQQDFPIGTTQVCWLFSEYSIVPIR